MPKNFIKTKVDTRVAVAVVLIAIAIGVSASIATLIPSVGGGKFSNAKFIPGIGECNLKTALKADGTHPDCRLLDGGLYCINKNGLGDCVQCLSNQNCQNYPLLGETYPGNICTSEHNCSCNSNADCNLVSGAFCKREVWYDKIQQKPFNVSPATGYCVRADAINCDDLRGWEGDFHDNKPPFADYYDEYSYECTRLGGQFDTPKTCYDSLVGGERAISVKCEKSKMGDQIGCCEFKSEKVVN